MPVRAAILASAGSGKSTEVVKRALAATGGRVLLVTFTIENQRRLETKLRETAGLVPEHIKVVGWYSFLISQCIKPYQRAITDIPFLVRGLNFVAPPPRYEKKDSPRFFLDGNCDLYKDRLSQLAVQLNALTNGAVARRIMAVYRHILVDEVQDCGGYDLDFLDILLATDVNICFVGDPRQSILSTNHGTRNKKYRQQGLWSWFDERSKSVSVEVRAENHRCHPLVCEFADSIFPTLPPSKSTVTSTTGHDGVFVLSDEDVDWYLQTFQPSVLLRDSKKTHTGDHDAVNIGHAKGATYERVLLFPTQPMVFFLATRNASTLGAPERLYVAVTRARLSVAIVVPKKALAKVLAHPLSVHCAPPSGNTVQIESCALLSEG